MHKLNPSIGPEKWRHGVEARFEFNAARCHKIARGLTDPAEKAYTLNLATLWEQLADAARFQHELRSARDQSPGDSKDQKGDSHGDDKSHGALR